jgi:hypothetical protein
MAEKRRAGGLRAPLPLHEAMHAAFDVKCIVL